MLPGEELRRGEEIRSKNGKYSMAMLEDGNVILDFNGFPVRTTQTTDSGFRMKMETNGNCVIYDEDGRSIWETRTANNGNYLVIQDDANIAIYNVKGEMTWSQRTVFSRFILKDFHFK